MLKYQAIQGSSGGKKTLTPKKTSEHSLAKPDHIFICIQNVGAIGQGKYSWLN